MQTAGAVIIGDEILSGKVQDANTPHLIAMLARRGVRLGRIIVIGDDPQEIGAAVKAQAERFDHVFTSGGVGPTHDDRTVAAIAAAFGRPVVRHPELVALLTREIGAAPDDPALKMSEVVDGTQLLGGGPYPIMRFENVYILPGVPQIFAAKIDAEDPTWSGRYQLTKTDITTYSGTLSLAYQLTETLAVGGGVTVEYFDGKFERTEIGPGGFDYTGFLEGDDVEVGFSAGLIWKPHDGTTIGLAYRSQMDHDFNGSAGLRDVVAYGAQYDLTMPQIVSLGIRQKLHSGWTLLGEIEWQDFSTFTGFDIALAPPSPVSRDVRPQSWDDSWIFAIGAEYRPDEKNTWRFGIQYDTAVSDGGGNTLSPDADRIMVGLGYERQVSDRFKWSAFYAHVFYDDAAINVTPSATNTQGTLIGSMETDLDMFGVSGTFTW